MRDQNKYLMLHPNISDCPSCQSRVRSYDCMVKSLYGSEKVESLILLNRFEITALDLALHLEVSLLHTIIFPQASYGREKAK